MHMRAWEVTREHRRECLQRYADYFFGCSPVLDIGCGDGIFMELLREKGISPIGIDTDQEKIRQCRDSGFDQAYVGEATDFLKERKSCLGGVFCSHVIEHMHPDQAMSLITLSHDALMPGGILVVITLNPGNLYVVTHSYWADTEHVRLYPLSLLERMFSSAGFRVMEKGEGRYLLSQSRLRKIILPFKRILMGRALFGLNYSSQEIYIAGKKA